MRGLLSNFRLTRLSVKKPTVVTGYTFTTGNDTDTFPYRNPRSWFLMGSNDYDEDTKEARWYKLHSMTKDITMEGKSFASYSGNVNKCAVEIYPKF